MGGIQVDGENGTEICFLHVEHWGDALKTPIEEYITALYSLRDEYDYFVASPISVVENMVLLPEEK